MFIAINVIDPGRGKCNNYGPSVLRVNNYNVSNIAVVLTLKMDVSHYFFYIGSGVIIISYL